MCQMWVSHRSIHRLFLDPTPMCNSRNQVFRLEAVNTEGTNERKVTHRMLGLARVRIILGLVPRIAVDGIDLQTMWDHTLHAGCLLHRFRERKRQQQDGLICLQPVQETTIFQCSMHSSALKLLEDYSWETYCGACTRMRREPCRSTKRACCIVEDTTRSLTPTKDHHRPRDSTIRMTDDQNPRRRRR